MFLNAIGRLCLNFRATNSILTISNNAMHTITQSTSNTLKGSAVPNASSALAGGAWSLLFVRTKIRDNFPRPKETKRIKIHGYNTRMSTATGRRILMRRILKGRHVLAH